MQGLATSPVVLLLVQLQLQLVGAAEDVADVVVEVEVFTESTFGLLQYF